MAENEKNIGTTISLEKKEQLELDRSVGCSPAHFPGGAELGLSMQARSSVFFSFWTPSKFESSATLKFLLEKDSKFHLKKIISTANSVTLGLAIWHALLGPFIVFGRAACEDITTRTLASVRHHSWSMIWLQSAQLLRMTKSWSEIEIAIPPYPYGWPAQPSRR